jgi:hypothetical protein
MYDLIFDTKEHYASNPIHIVYYMYLKEPRWKMIVSGQLQDIIDSGIPAHISIVICSHADSLIHAGVSLIKDMLELYKFGYDYTTQTKNQFEYPGIKRLYDLALEKSPDTLFLYMHSKGMVFHEQDGRLDHEIILTRELLQWKAYCNIFDTYSNVNKAGGYAGPYPGRPTMEGHDGFIYYNFFWARGSYIKTLTVPKLPRENEVDDRWYYEFWLGNGSLGDCYSTSIHKIGCANPFEPFS